MAQRAVHERESSGRGTGPLDSVLALKGKKSVGVKDRKLSLLQDAAYLLCYSWATGQSDKGRQDGRLTVHARQIRTGSTAESRRRRHAAPAGGHSIGWMTPLQWVKKCWGRTPLTLQQSTRVARCDPSSIQNARRDPSSIQKAPRRNNIFGDVCNTESQSGRLNWAWGGGGDGRETAGRRRSGGRR